MISVATTVVKFHTPDLTSTKIIVYVPYNQSNGWSWWFSHLAVSSSMVNSPHIRVRVGFHKQTSQKHNQISQQRSKPPPVIPSSLQSHKIHNHPHPINPKENSLPPLPINANPKRHPKSPSVQRQLRIPI